MFFNESNSKPALNLGSFLHYAAGQKPWENPELTKTIVDHLSSVLQKGPYGHNTAKNPCDFCRHPEYMSAEHSFIEDHLKRGAHDDILWQKYFPGRINMTYSLGLMHAANGHGPSHYSRFVNSNSIPELNNILTEGPGVLSGINSYMSHWGPVEARVEPQFSCRECNSEEHTILSHYLGTPERREIFDGGGQLNRFRELAKSHIKNVRGCNGCTRGGDRQLQDLAEGDLS